MTHEMLEAYIEIMNYFGTDEFPRELQGQVFLRPISDTVDVTRLWNPWPTGEYGNEYGYTIYFIKNSDAQYVAAVFVMDNIDLHVLVKPAYRKQGHLTRALQEWILPHLFNDGREFQQITYEDEEARHHALKCGFTEIEPGKAQIMRENVQLQPELRGKDIPISFETLGEIKHRLWHVKGLLNVTKDQLEMAYDESGECMLAMRVVQDLVLEIEDLYFERNEYLLIRLKHPHFAQFLIQCRL